ncbi:hypothetical protein BN1723_002005 [Verticillium longisporum]|uniref:Uncharacterized protein n=1 Tax=Verticillium longisporum TaxID=100787 RepID=A0A0G4KWD4_VERLO|nr:hypothetical protein BN1723_002005 [Verticillium longisporum]
MNHAPGQSIPVLSGPTSVISSQSSRRGSLSYSLSEGHGSYALSAFEDSVTDNPSRLPESMDHIESQLIMPTLAVPTRRPFTEQGKALGRLKLLVAGDTEAALDAIAPIEDKDDANTGPVDSDEETAAVMSALSHWNPQPVVPQPVVNPIKRNYQLARLHEQLQMATNGGRTSIFKVVGFGAQKLPEGHLSNLADGEDAPGEPDSAIVFGVPGRSSSFGMQGQEQRRPSVSSRG